MAYIRACVQNLGAIRRPVRKTCLSSLIIDVQIYDITVVHYKDTQQTVKEIQFNFRLPVYLCNPQHDSCVDWNWPEDCNLFRKRN